MNTPETLTGWSALTELIAEHGVFALVVIFIFYLQSRAVKNLANATPKDHNHFRRVHSAVVVATFVLVFLASAAWWYAGYRHVPESYIKGAVLDLIEQPNVPLNPTDPPLVEDKLTPASAQVEIYEYKKSDESFVKGKYNLTWVLFRPAQSNMLDIAFEHHYRIYRENDPSSNPSGKQGSSKWQEGTDRKKFRLDLRALHTTPGTFVQMVYKEDPDDKVRKAGQLFLRDDQTGKDTPLEERKDEPGATSSISVTPEGAAWLAFIPFRSVYARSTQKPSIFDGNGGYDPQVGRTLRQRLGSPDLRTQLEAVNVLVDGGARSLKFIGDSLDDTTPGTSFDRGLLVGNLARAYEVVAAKGDVALPDLSLKFAISFYDLQDYKNAARFFDKAGDRPPKDDLLFYFRRGFAYNMVGEYDKSIEDYRRFLEKVKVPRWRAVALSNQGSDYRMVGREKEAVENYKKAMEIDPSYASSYNNLAYLYAETGKNLPSALSLVNRALSLESNNPRFEDTKAAILYKLGRKDEAKALFRQAAAAVPYDRTIQMHLAAAEKGAPLPSELHGL
jgi:Flp pilus assembly protein TadD